eukprot:Em0001g3006a
MECIYTIAGHDSFDWVPVGRRFLSDQSRDIGHEGGSGRDCMRNKLFLKWKTKSYQAFVKMLRPIENSTTVNHVEEFRKRKSLASTFNHSTTYVPLGVVKHAEYLKGVYKGKPCGERSRLHPCAAGSVLLSPQGNYTVFQSNASAVFNCSGDGFVVSWVLNGSSYNAEHRQRGIIVALNPPSGTTTSSSLLVPSSAANNNTEVVCRVIDSTFSNVQTSDTSSITIQGPLVAPYDFSVAMSNTSNATLILSWGAPFSLDVTGSPEILYYTLCTNITIYGCRTIHSDPDCSFPRKCTLVIDITNSSLIGADERQTKVNVSYGDYIQFTFFAVNGAGNGDVANFVFLYILPGKSG